MTARTLRVGILVLGVALLAVAAGLAIGWSWPGRAVPAKPAVSITAVTATPSRIEPVDVLTIGTTLYNASGRLDDVTVELAVYDDAGTPVLHERQSGLGISAEASQAVYWVWRIPQRLQDGPYVVGITVSETGGKAVLARNDNAATFQVARVTRR